MGACRVLVELGVVEAGVSVDLLRQLREKGATLYVVGAESRRSRADVVAALSWTGFGENHIGLGAQLAATQLGANVCVAFGDPCFVNDLRASGVSVIEPDELGNGKAWDISIRPVGWVVIAEDSRWRFRRSAIATRCVIEGGGQLGYVGGNVIVRGDVATPGGRALAASISVASLRDPVDVAGFDAAVAFAGGCDVMIVHEGSGFDVDRACVVRVGSEGDVDSAVRSALHALREGGSA